MTPSVAPAEVGFRLNQVQRFLRLLYTSYPMGIGFFADLLPLLFDEPLEIVSKKAVEDLVRRAASDGFVEWKHVQQELLERFRVMLDEAKKSQGHIVEMEKMSLQVSEAKEGGTFFRLVAEPIFAASTSNLAEKVIRRVALYLVGLPDAVIRECEVCKHYFFDAAMRQARHCSQPCRYRGRSQPGTPQKPDRKKSQKRG